MIRSSLFIENRAEGVLYLAGCEIMLSESVRLLNNTGSSLILFNNNLMLTKPSYIEITNTASSNGIIHLPLGGAITAFQSKIVIYDKCILFNNSAENGGALHAIESKVFVYGDMLVTSNIARKSGGGLYLYQSELNCEDNGTLKFIGNSANESGGGIHVIGSIIKISFNIYVKSKVCWHISEDVHTRAYYTGSLVYFIANTAKRGGGVCLELSSKIYILKLFTQWYINTSQILVDKQPLLFSANVAYEYGGAVYVADDTNSGTCSSLSPDKYSALTECSFQMLALYDTTDNDMIVYKVINFEENYAPQTLGSSIFGGLLDRCTISPFDVVQIKNKTQIVDGFTHLRAISTINNFSTVSFHAVKTCFCKDGKPNCNYGLQLTRVNAMKGRLFYVSLIAVDHVNHPVNATIRSSLYSIFGGLGENQTAQKTSESCTDLWFRVFSPHPSEQLVLYADGPCRDAQISKGEIHIDFLPCTCPAGFQPNETTRCSCVCDPKLSKFITVCHEENRTLERTGTFWIDFIYSEESDREVEYLIYPRCPLNYCHPPTMKVYIYLDLEDTSDTQCNFNRSGTLCGRCQAGLSMSLASSRCIQCSKRWSAYLVMIILFYLFAGIVLGCHDFSAQFNSCHWDAQWNHILCEYYQYKCQLVLSI